MAFRTDRRQQERFTTRIRNVIREYPWGLGVFKEFLANADDAGAKAFVVILDKRQHSKVRPPSLGHFLSLHIFDTPPLSRPAAGPSLALIAGGPHLR